MLLIVCLVVASAQIASASSNSVDPSAVSVVHLVQSNHVDIGFADYADGIMNRYLRGGAGTLGPPHPRNESVNFSSFLLTAAATATALRARGDGIGLRYMTQAYVASYFFDCDVQGSASFPAARGKAPVRCPNATEKATLAAAVRRGDVYWHAFPHNAQPELMDASLFRAGINFTRVLAARFGRAPPAVLSQRDVPGLSRAAIPLLAESGVIGISIGVNDGSPPPLVPSVTACYTEGRHTIRTPFVWIDRASATSILVDVHPGGYGGVLPLIPGTTPPTPYYSRDGVLCDCVGVEGFDEVLCYAWKGDNYGPAGVNETIATFKVFRARYPNATIIASTPDAWFNRIDANASLRASLPVVDQEIGDTWIYGAASDPLKLAMMRAMMRARAACIARGASTCAAEEPKLADFTRLLLKLPEHTWGGCGCAHMDLAMPTDSFTAIDLAAARANRSTSRDPFYTVMETTWDEQRSFIAAALSALDDTASSDAATTAAATAATTAAPSKSALGTALRAELAALQAPPPSAASAAAAGYAAVPRARWSETFTLGNFIVGLNLTSGALTTLTDTRSGLEWASAARPALRFAYRTHAYHEAVTYKRAYGYAHGGEFPYPAAGSASAFSWPWVGMNRTATVAQAWHGRVVGLWRRSEELRGTSSSSALIELALPVSQDALRGKYGAPATVWLNLTAAAPIKTLGGSAAAARSPTKLSVELVWANKSATRLLESIWLEMRPRLPSAAERTWRTMLDKLGGRVDAARVVPNGGGALHGIDPHGGVALEALGADPLNFTVTSRDAGVVAPGASGLGLSPINFTAPPPSGASDGFAWLLFTNLYEVNYPMWYPWKSEDAVSRFRFELKVEGGGNVE